MADNQQMPFAAGDGKIVERLLCVVASGGRRMRDELRQEIAARLRSDLGGLRSSHLRADEREIDASPDPLERSAGNLGLPTATLGELSQLVRAGAMWLGVCVAEQPELTGHRMCEHRAEARR